MRTILKYVAIPLFFLLMYLSYAVYYTINKSYKESVSNKNLTKIIAQLSGIKDGVVTKEVKEKLQEEFLIDAVSEKNFLWCGNTFKYDYDKGRRNILLLQPESYHRGMFPFKIQHDFRRYALLENGEIVNLHGPYGAGFKIPTE